MKETKECFHCKSEIDKRATICPYCREMPDERTANWIFIIALVLTLGCLAMIACVVLAFVGSV